MRLRAEFHPQWMCVGLPRNPETATMTQGPCVAGRDARPLPGPGKAVRSVAGRWMPCSGKCCCARQDGNGRGWCVPGQAFSALADVSRASWGELAWRVAEVNIRASTPIVKSHCTRVAACNTHFRFPHDRHGFQRSRLANAHHAEPAQHGLAAQAEERRRRRIHATGTASPPPFTAYH